MCEHPITIINPKYRKRAKELRVSHRHFDQERDYRLVVPCGHCVDCLARRRKMWVTRSRYLVESRNIKIDRNSGKTYFCTFSIAPKHYKKALENPYAVIRKFLDRVRKHPKLIVGYSKKGRPIYKKVKLDYFFVIEFADGSRAKERGLPSTHRMHFHAILYDWPLTMKDTKKIWDLFVGIAWLSRLRSEAGISYCLKYMFKDNGNDQKIFGDESKHNGKLIVSHGYGRIRQQDRIRLRNQLLATSESWFVYYINNFRYPVPRYWKKSLFTDKEIRLKNAVLVPKLIEESVKRRFPYASQIFRQTLIDYLLWP